MNVLFPQGSSFHCTTRPGEELFQELLPRLSSCGLETVVLGCFLHNAGKPTNQGHFLLEQRWVTHPGQCDALFGLVLLF